MYSVSKGYADLCKLCILIERAIERQGRQYQYSCGSRLERGNKSMNQTKMMCLAYENQRREMSLLNVD